MSLAVNTLFYRDPVRAFVESLVIEAGFSELPIEEKARLAEALLVEAHKRVGLGLMGAIDSGSLEYFEQLMAGGATDDELSAFFSVRLPDAEDRVHRILSAFGAECREAAKELNGLL